MKLGFKIKNISLVPEEMKNNMEKQEIYLSLKIKRMYLYSTGSNEWKVAERELNRIIKGFFTDKNQIESVRCVSVTYTI